MIDPTITPSKQQNEVIQQTNTNQPIYQQNLAVSPIVVAPPQPIMQMQVQQGMPPQIAVQMQPQYVMVQPLNNEVFSSQKFMVNGVEITAPPEIKNITEEEMKKIQKKEVENFPVRNDCCYDKMFLNLIGELGIILFVILSRYISPFIHVLTAVFGIVFIVDFFISNTFHFLRRKILGKDVIANIERLKQAFPRITWSIQCYHYETRTRYVSDSNGGGHTETYEERVNTHFAKHELKIRGSSDVTKYSDLINHIQMIQMSRLYFAKQYSFDSEITANYFASLKQYFISINKRDVYYDFWEDFVIDGFIPRMVAHNGDKIGRVYSIPFYIFMTLFGFGWLLRLLFYKNTFCGDVRVHKIIML